MSALTFFGMSLSAAAQVADLRPLEAEAAKALEAYGFMKEAEHSMSVGFRPFGPKEWWEQLEQDPWAMALFAEKELEVAVWKEPPYVSWHIAGRYALNFMSRPQQTDQWSNTWSTRIRIATARSPKSPTRTLGRTARMR
jgi:phage head maturation protease